MSTKTTIAVRIAPRRSPRPARVLITASARLTAVRSHAAKTPGAPTPPAATGVAFQVPPVRNATSLPRYDAASILIGRSGCSGYAPVHDARSSIAIGGVHSDATLA